MRLRILFTLLLLLPAVGFAKKKRPSVSPRMKLHGSSYSLDYTFSSTLPRRKVLDILFKYEHVKNNEKLQMTITAKSLKTNTFFIKKKQVC